MKKFLGFLFLFIASLGFSQSIQGYEYNRVPYTGATNNVDINGYYMSGSNFMFTQNNVTSSASTTSLIVNSGRVQQLIGATTHTFNLPNATTCKVGTTYEFNNNSSGNLTINDFTGSSQKTVVSGGYVRATCSNTSTSAGQWDFHFLLPANAQYGTSGMLVTGNFTATGTGNYSGAITSPTVYGSSAAGGTINVLGTSDASGGVVNISKSTGTTQINSLTNITNSTTIGTGTVAANTSSLGIVRIKQGSSFWDIGDYGSGYAGLWANQSIPTTTNYAIASGANSLEFLNPMGINMNIAGNTKFYVSTGYCYARNLLRVGSNAAPSATLDVTGTMSVSGTSTLTGAAKMTNTLNYEGNTTWNTNQTNTLTTGNTGTVAVLSDAVFPVNFNGDVSTVSDGVNYYWGNNTYMFGGATSNGTITIPYNCTLIGWDFSNVNGGTLATSETATLSIKGTTNYTCSSSITFSASSFQSTSGTISVNFTAGDRINASLLMPTFATNPSFIFCGLTLWFVRRQ